MSADLAAMPPGPGGMSDLDLKGLRCPLPVLRTRKALAALQRGQLIRVHCTDPLASLDIPHLCRETGDVLLLQERGEAVQTFVIRKA